MQEARADAAPLTTSEQALLRFLQAPYVIVVPVILSLLAGIYFGILHDPDKMVR